MEGKNGYIVLLLEKFFKSSLQDLVVSCQWPHRFVLGFSGQLALTHNKLRGEGMPPEKSVVFCQEARGHSRFGQGKEEGWLLGLARDAAGNDEQEVAGVQGEDYPPPCGSRPSLKPCLTHPQTEGTNGHHLPHQAQTGDPTMICVPPSFGDFVSGRDARPQLISTTICLLSTVPQRLRREQGHW